MSALKEPCLILNSRWEVVTFLPVQTAITTVFRDMGSILDVQDYLLLSFEEWAELGRKSDRMIKTPTGEIAAPDVVVLKKYGERPPRRVLFNRPNLSRRDHHECQYCGADLKRERLTIEHILPRSRGGGTSWANCVAACEDCNSRKANLTPDEAGMKLRKIPSKPTWVPKITVPNGKIRPVWRPFLEKEGVV